MALDTAVMDIFTLGLASIFGKEEIFRPATAGIQDLFTVHRHGVVEISEGIVVAVL